ncbi:hypothetical protein DMB95_01445 [Campylobacter sp. MIT 12-8780]|uniref:NTP transferase domain-containing protein n=1 Tax=unclassified Campylobacter TaxID=2593542 RepID=UPI00115F75D5|nr:MULTISPECIES: NTP transferase domain-containing protein [unclassified Campylobacter]NDJ26624.1 NTP transferase domain-containing protein [Campylobacter sp. MIT 19-121]TQR43185.1 hypothetical protein DMB95_01445 [Campylobacter sp. MIT 12-8780]
MSFCIVIPAQENNQYHKMGDLAPFGDTSLLKWKIAQCKEFADDAQIYISAYGEQIKKIAYDENVNYIERKPGEIYTQTIQTILTKLDKPHIIWVYCTTPFIGANIYEAMYKKFLQKQDKIVISVKQIKEFVFYKNTKLNFTNNISTRANIDPLQIISNGCFIFDRDKASKLKDFFLLDFELFLLDSLASIEIKDMQDYIITKELITLYFRKEYHEFK